MVSQKLSWLNVCQREGVPKYLSGGGEYPQKTPGKILFYFPSLVIFLKTGDISEGGGRSDLIEKI